MPRQPKPLPLPTPGEILLEEFLKPMKITPYRLAKDLRVPVTRVAAILKGTRAITADTSLRLGRYFGQSDRFWLNIQTGYDLERAKEALGEELKAIPERPEVTHA
jgi:addiction module HigA family antidote